MSGTLVIPTLFQQAGETFASLTVSGDVAAGSITSSGAVSGTTGVFTTSVRSPLYVGGTTTTSSLTLKTTTGVGTTNADMIFVVGNNGGTEAMRILNSGFVGIGSAAASAKLTVASTATGSAASVTNALFDINETLSGNSALQYIACRNLARVSTGGFDLTTALGIIGFLGQARITTGAGTVTAVAAANLAVQNQAAATLTSGYGLYVTATTNSGGGSVGSSYGVHVEANTVGTNIYAYSASIAAAATRWNVYCDGTAQNHLAGNLGIGGSNTTPLTALHVVTTGTGSVRGVLNAQHSATTDGGRFISRKSRGTLGSPTVITTGDTLASWIAEGYDGAAYLQMGAILINSIGTIGTNRVPTAMVFQTATDAATSVLTTALTLNKDQTATFAAGITGTTFSGTGILTALSGTAPVANGSQALALNNTAAFGVYTGSGAPTVSAAQGSIYIRTNGTGAADRAYINTNGSTTWTAIVTVA